VAGIYLNKADEQTQRWSGITSVSQRDRAPGRTGHSTAASGLPEPISVGSSTEKTPSPTIRSAYVIRPRAETPASPQVLLLAPSEIR